MGVPKQHTRRETASVLAPPLITLVLLLTSDRDVMGARANPPLLQWVGWATAATMSAPAVAMIVTALL